MKNQTLLLTIIAAGVVSVLVLQIVSLTVDTGSARSTSGETVESLRDFAAQLKANQLYEKSAAAYDEYVARSGRPDKEKANIDFNTGKMLLDQVGDAEGALARFLRVTHLYSEVDPAIVKEARRLSAECLEVLGRSGAAERQLVEATRLVPADSTSEQSIEEADLLAAIGTRISIGRNDFEEAWKEIPAQVRQQEFPGVEGKRRFLEEMVAAKLYAEAARRKGFDRDPRFRRRLQTLEESFLANRLLQEEVAGKVTLSDSDLRLFYEANKARYSEPASVEVAHILVPDVTAAQTALASIESGSAFEEIAKTRSIDTATQANGGRIGRLRQNPPALVGEPPTDPLDISIPGIGTERTLVEAAFGIAEVGAIGGPVETARGFHLIRLLDRTEVVEQDFERAKPFVERDLRARKEQEKQAELVAELMKAHKVRIHGEKLN